jgi:hypothetical protein
MDIFVILVIEVIFCIVFIGEVFGGFQIKALLKKEGIWFFSGRITWLIGFLWIFMIEELIIFIFLPKFIYFFSIKAAFTLQKVHITTF